MNQAELGELITEQQGGVKVVRKGDSGVLAVIERKLGVELDRPCLERINSVEYGGCSTTMCVIVRGDVPKFLDDRYWDDDLVLSQTEREWIGIVVSNDPETDESGGVCDELRHL